MASLVGKLITFLPLVVFTVGFLYTTGALIAMEPYQRIIVGATVDTGSRILSLLAPTAGYLGLVFGGIALVLYLCFKGLVAAASSSPTIKKLADA